MDNGGAALSAPVALPTVQRPASYLRAPLRRASPRHQPSLVLCEYQTWPSFSRRFILPLWIGHQEGSAGFSGGLQEVGKRGS